MEEKEMIIQKDWVRFKSAHKDIYTGIFLFGFIPLYIKRQRVSRF